MTKEEREKSKAYFQSRLEWKKENRYPYVSAQEAEIYKIALEALDQEPCEDAISRQAALECFTWTNDKADVWNRIKELSSVNPQPKTGYWIYELEDWNKWTCSECGWSKRTDVHVKLGYNFCPNCGADMGGTENE